MLDVSRISDFLLNDIISNMGWREGEDKAPYLAQVAQMEPIEALRCYAAWQLGYRSWGDAFARNYDELRAAQLEAVRP